MRQQSRLCQLLGQQLDPMCSASAARLVAVVWTTSGVFCMGLRGGQGSKGRAGGRQCSKGQEERSTADAGCQQGTGQEGKNTANCQHAEHANRCWNYHDAMRSGSKR